MTGTVWPNGLPYLPVYGDNAMTTEYVLEKDNDGKVSVTIRVEGKLVNIIWCDEIEIYGGDLYLMVGTDTIMIIEPNDGIVNIGNDDIING